MAELVRQAADQPGIGDQPSLPGARRLEDAGRSRRAAQRASSCCPGCTTRARCRWRCRRPRCTWRRMRGMEVVVLRPEGFALPAPIMAKARAAAAAAGGSVTRDQRARRRARRRARALRQGMGLAPRTTAMPPADARAARRASRTGACAMPGSSAPPPRLPRHALPAGAAQRRGRRRSARWSAQRRAARGLQPPDGADGRAAPAAQA